MNVLQMLADILQMLREMRADQQWYHRDDLRPKQWTPKPR